MDTNVAFRKAGAAWAADRANTHAAPMVGMILAAAAGQSAIVGLQRVGLMALAGSRDVLAGDDPIEAERLLAKAGLPVGDGPGALAAFLTGAAERLVRRLHPREKVAATATGRRPGQLRTLVQAALADSNVVSNCMHHGQLSATKLARRLTADPSHVARLVRQLTGKPKDGGKVRVRAARTPSE